MLSVVGPAFLLRTTRARSVSFMGGVLSPPILAPSSPPGAGGARMGGERTPPMKLPDLARVVRSKNAGPTTLSIDLMFPDADAYRRARASSALTAAAIAPLYGVPTQRVQVIPYEPALAIKIVLDRT